MDPWLEKELKKIKRRIPKERKQKLDLNMQLLEICRAETINYEKVEDLLRQGAEPLGYIVESDGWPDNLYSAVQNHLYRGCDTGEDFYNITELFLRYGMDIGKPAVPYDRDWVLNPISSYLGVKNDCMLRTMRLLLDHGLRIRKVRSCISFIRNRSNRFPDRVARGLGAHTMAGVSNNAGIVALQ